MKIEATGFRGLFLLEPRILGDERGYFMESFSVRTLEEGGIEVDFVQDNQSSSSKGVLRGFHFQNAPYAQTKLVRTISGNILDIVLDLRKNEPTFGKHFSVELSAQNKIQLLVPKGFAHGFVVLSDQAEVLYKCDEYYYPNSEGGIIYNDPDLAIDWKLPESSIILSEKDKRFLPLRDIIYRF